MGGGTLRLAVWALLFGPVAATSSTTQVENALRTVLRDIAQQGELLNEGFQEVRTLCTKYQKQLRGWRAHEQKLARQNPSADCNNRTAECDGSVSGGKSTPIQIRRKQMALVSRQSFGKLETLLQDECSNSGLNRYGVLESNLRMDASAAVTKALSLLADTPDSARLMVPVDSASDDDVNSTPPGTPFASHRVATSFLQKLAKHGEGGGPTTEEQGLRRLVRAGQVLEESSGQTTGRMDVLFRQLSTADMRAVKQDSLRSVKDCGSSLRKQMSHVTSLRERVRLLESTVGMFEVEGQATVKAVAAMDTSLTQLAAGFGNLGWPAQVEEIAQKRAPLSQKIIRECMQAVRKQTDLPRAPDILRALHDAGVAFEQQRNVHPLQEHRDRIHQLVLLTKHTQNELGRSLRLLQAGELTQDDERAGLQEELAEATRGLEEATDFQATLKRLCTEDLKGERRRHKLRLKILEKEQGLFQRGLEQKELDAIH